jgi:hypothetical protein
VLHIPTQRGKSFFLSEVPENIHINYIILLNYDYKIKLPNFAQYNRDVIVFIEEKYKGTLHSLRSNCMRGWCKKKDKKSMKEINFKLNCRSLILHLSWTNPCNIGLYQRMFCISFVELYARFQ